MYIFTWIDSNYRSNNLTVNGINNALAMYNILHDNIKAHNLKCLMKTDKNERYVVFVNNKMITV